MPLHSATAIRVFTHPAAPRADQVVQQTLGAARGIVAAMVINADVDADAAIEMGILGLPAVVVEMDGIELARRECVRPGRSLRRWLDRHVGIVESNRVEGGPNDWQIGRE